MMTAGSKDGKQLCRFGGSCFDEYFITIMSDEDVELCKGVIVLVCQ